jgi:predicted house-cleaning noncanonical NTP pyrophosphatase (MazG superfamily)
MPPPSSTTAITSLEPRPESALDVDVGGKAAGLFVLPDGWTPPFFVIGRGWEYGEALEWLLAVAGAKPDWQGIIVRSNATSESQSDARGAYDSVPVACDRVAVRDAIERVLAQPTRPGDEMLAVVQVAVRALAAGHLSNERHVAERRTQWVLDEESTRVGSEAQTLSARDKGSDVLLAADRPALLSALRHISFRLSECEQRVHCEWIWDGSRVWVVQRDTEVERCGGSVHDYLSARPATSDPAEEPQTAVIRRLAAEETSKWSKLRRPTVMQALGMLTAPVWHLEGNTFLADAHNSYSNVLADLQALIARGPLVVRCDVAADRGYEDLSLQTSDPVTSAAAALEFMQMASSTAFAGMEPEEWAFLPASLVPARASVMAQARPGSQLVRLHALWGFPDGVGLLGHDKWSCDMATDVVEERRAHKASCCLPVDGQGWRFEPVPQPHDWGHTINELEARTAASWARRLADHLDREVQLMVLARIDARRGPDAMLAWHYTDHIVPPAQQHVAVAPSAGVVVVRHPSDLEHVDLTRQRGVLLRPDAMVRRDAGFLTEVGTIVAQADVPIYFEGSILGHPYYLLRSAGAVVVPVGRNEPGGVRIEYNKLVRDRVPDVVKSSGGSARVVRASHTEARWLLRQKLVEEAFEVAGASGEQLVEELADLTEVLAALVRHADVEPEAIDRARAEKRAARGGFDELLYLEATSSHAEEEPDSFKAPPLFGTEAGGGQVPAPQPASPAVTIEESNAQRIVLRVPAMAPTRKGVPLREYRLEIGQGTIRFRHDGSELELTLELRVPSQGQGQLSLPVELA